MSVFLTYFLLVGKKRGDGFYVGFQKMVNVYFMYHPSGWDIKYTFSLYYSTLESGAESGFREDHCSEGPGFGKRSGGQFGARLAK